jgi:anthranilate synthase/aminodeoxychorismate synthase-like glutamine amidotransferase
VSPSVVVLDNHDSFTWNLVQYLRGEGAECTVLQSDVATISEIVATAPKGILLSPGPGAPDEAGITLEVVSTLSDQYPLLGVCLGFQAIAQSFGGTVRRAKAPVHGRARPVMHRGEGLFDGIPSPFLAARYHSLGVDAASLPAALVPLASSDDGELMALRHATRPTVGVQFHPESILTEYGKVLIRNWLQTL